MKNRLAYLALLFALLLSLAWPVGAWARGQEGEFSSPLHRRLDEDKFVFGGSYTLESGERLDGDLIVFGGNVTLEVDSEVAGDVIVMGGNLVASGQVDGSVSCIGGNVTLNDTAVVDGDVTVAGGANLDRAEGSEIDGDVHSGRAGPFDFSFPRRGYVPGIRMSITPLADALWFLFQTFFWAGLAVLLVMFLPNHVERTANAAISQPLVTGGVGLLTLIVAIFLLPILAITIILLPASLLGALLLAVAWLFGMAALGLEVGRRLERQFRQEWPLAVSAGIGTFVFVLVIFGISKIVPCIGWAFPVIAGLVGIGAVLLTRFGVLVYPPMVSTSVVPTTAGGPGPGGTAASGASWSAPAPAAGGTPPATPDVDEADWRPLPPDESNPDQ
jgi:hypothetical protein